MNSKRSVTLLAAIVTFANLLLAEFQYEQPLNSLANQVVDQLNENDNSNEPSTGDMLIPQALGDYDEDDLNPFKVVYQWRRLDFEYPTYERRQRALYNGEFTPQSNLPLGIEVTKNRVFLTTPRWKDGVPASLSWLPYPPEELSPPLRPYPSWDEHGDPYNPDCSKLISVYRLSIDNCNRIWAIDSGIVNATVNLNPVCPPKIVAFDLGTNKRILTYEFPPEQVKQDSLHSNIIVDIRGTQCSNAYVYVTDVWRFGIVVYSLAKNRSWRVTNHLFYPNPLASDFNLYGLNFQWLDGVFGMSISPVTNHNDRILFFHPMASHKEFMVSTAVLQDEMIWQGKGAPKAFLQIGDRGIKGQSSTAGIDRDQVMFYTLVHQDAIGCWDINKAYTRSNLAVVAFNFTELMFPNDLKVDKEEDQGVWVVSNRLPIFLYSQLDFNDINFNILRANTRTAVKGTVCDPKEAPHVSVVEDVEECY